MRTYQGIPVESLPPSNSAEFTPRLRDMLAALDLWARDASHAFGRIQQGQVPSSSGEAIPAQTTVDLSQYLYLPGRSGGQTVLSTAIGDVPLSVQGVSGQTADLQEWKDGSGNLRMEIAPTGGGTLTIGDPAVEAVTIIGSVAGPGGTIYTQGSSSPRTLNLQADATASNATLSITNSHWIQVQGARLDWATNTPALLGVDAAAWTAATTDAYDNIRIIRRSASQTGYAIRFMDQTRAITLFGVTAAGVIVGQGTATSDLTAQTGSVGAQTLLTGSTTTGGAYRISAYLKTTTAQAASSVLMTLAWNDGTAQTIVMPLESATAIFNSHDLTTLNAHSQGSVFVNSAASQNITYTTTITGGGTAAYEIHVRIEALG